MSFKEYYNLLLQDLEGLKTKGDVIIFGTGQMGAIALKTLKHFNQNIVCCCDNGNNKLDGIELLAMEEGFKKAPNAKVFVCVFDLKNEIAITNSLIKAGFKNICQKDILFFAYSIEVVKRKVDNQAFAKGLYDLRYSENKIIIKNVSAIITEKCTLRCKECGVFIPYYKNPKNHGKEGIIKSIKRLAQTVDCINILTIMGGEPFLHPNLNDICEEVSKIPNIANLVLTTNGTLLPKDEMLQSLKNSVTHITLSNYGALSKNTETLIAKLKQYNILYNILPEETYWYKQNKPYKHNRNIEENSANFAECFWVDVASKLINGQYHLCDYSAAIAPFNAVEKGGEDYVDFLNDNLTDEELKAGFINLTQNKKVLNVCDYCEIYSLPKTKRAEQAKGVLSIWK